MMAVITGTDDADFIETMAGDDVVDALGGDDYILGSRGFDLVDGGSGVDALAFLRNQGFTRIAGDRTFTFGPASIADSAGEIDTSFSNVETIEIAGTFATGNTILDASALTGPFGVTVQVGGQNIRATGSNQADSFVAVGATSNFDGGGGADQLNIGFERSDPMKISRQGAAVVFSNGIERATAVNVESFTVSSPLEFSGTIDASQADFAIHFSVCGGDVVIGGSGDDIFDNQIGHSAGGDRMTGGGGADQYWYIAGNYSVGNPIHNLDGDRITDFSPEDSITIVLGEFIGKAAFSGIGFPEYRYEIIGGQTLVQLDVNGDARGDATLTIENGAFELVVTTPGNIQISPAGGGTEGDDNLIGASSGEILVGLGGNDRLEGRGGDDQLYGGSGADELDGGLGNDILEGGADSDYLIDYEGNDTLNGGDGGDYLIVGSPGLDVVKGGTGNDRLSVNYTNIDADVSNIGGSTSPEGGHDGSFRTLDRQVDFTSIERFDISTGNGDDAITTFGGNDQIATGYGNDTLVGGGGDDYLEGGHGDDFIDGGDGIDYLSYYKASGPITVSLAITGQQNTGTGVDTVRNFENVVGSQYSDTLTGNDGDNILSGGPGGVDDFVGLAGDDWYFVDHAAETITEVDGEGSDRVLANVSYRLAAGASVETLSTDDDAATTAINLTGNNLAQFIRGNAGSNVLRGGGGGDDLSGLGGDDTYFIDNAAQTVQEDFGEGDDRIFSGVTYTLASYSFVEFLSTNDDGGASAISLTGNGYAQTLQGNAGNNVLRGGGGIDRFIGLGGNDWFYVDHAAETVAEAAGGGSDRVLSAVSYTLAAGAEVEILSTDNVYNTLAISLTGNGYAQTLQGNAGNNVLNGQYGDDILIGLGGKDSFVFSSDLDGIANVDRIADFAVGVDGILLDDTIFSGLSAGSLSGEAFATGTAASEADDRIIYNSVTGALLFDADGAGGAAAVQFASIHANAGLSATDFLVI